MTVGPPHSLSPWQMASVVFISSFCVTPFGFRALHAELAGGIWTAFLAQGAVVLFGTWGILRLARARDGNIVEVAKAAFGPVVGDVFLGGLVLYVLAWAPLGNLAMLLRILQSTSLRHTAPWLTAALMLGVAGYAAALGTRAYVRTTEVLAFFAIPAIVVVSFIGYVSPLHWSFAALPARLTVGPSLFGFALGARGFVLALAFLGSWGEAARKPASILVPMAASVALISLLVYLPHLIFPLSALTRLEFPSLSALGTIDATWVGLESILPLTLITWYIVSWVVVAGSVLGAGRVMRLWLGVPMPAAVAAILAVSLLGAQFAVNETLTMALIALWSYLGYAVVVIGPWLAWFLLRLRRSGGLVPAGA